MIFRKLKFWKITNLVRRSRSVLFLFFMLFNFSLFIAYPQTTNPLLAHAAPAPQKKKEKQKEKEKEKQKEVEIMPLDNPAEKTQEEIDEENTKLLNQKWDNYLLDRINEIQHLYNDVSQLDSSIVSKELLEEYHIALNNLKEKFDFKLGNDPLWKENDVLDDKRAQFSEIHARTVKLLKYWDEFLVAPKKTSKLIIIGMVLFAIMALVPIFSQIKAAISVKNAKKEAKKIMQQQQQDAERQRLLADENNIINIK